MNKFLVLLFTLNLIVVGCKKDKEESHLLKSASESTVLTPQDEENNLPSTSGSRAQSAMRTLYCIWEIIPGQGLQAVWCRCLWPAGNCLPTYTVSASNQNEYNDFLNSYNNGDLPTYFSGNDYQSLFPELDSLNVVDDLATGDIKMYQDSILHPDSMKLFIGLPKSITPSSSDSTWMDSVKVVLEIQD